MRPRRYSRHLARSLSRHAAAAKTGARDRARRDGQAGAVLSICPGTCSRRPASAVSRRRPVSLLCAAYVMNRPVHGHSRTNGSLSVPAGL